MTTLNLTSPSEASFVGTVLQTGTQAWIGFFGSAERSARYFSGVTIPQGATVSSAVVTLHVNAGDGTRTNMHAIARGSAADNTTGPEGSYAAFSATPKTTASTAFAGSASNFAIDVTAIVQEIVNRAGWVSGNGLNLYYDDNGSTPNTDIRITVGDTMAVTYSTGAPPPPPAFIGWGLHI